MTIWSSYRLRLRRKRLELRSVRKRRELKSIKNNTGNIKNSDILLFSAVNDEYRLLPYFLKYYRDLGVTHFLFVDNNSTDEGPKFLTEQDDVSLWTTNASYKKARFGVDWITYLMKKYGRNHWCVVVDPDELLVYPYCDTRPLPALTEWLESSSIRSLGTIMLDMYPNNAIDEHAYEAGQDPLQSAMWLDSGNYTYEKNEHMRNLWIQGGPRARKFFDDNPKKAPALNKIPLVKWRKGYVYESSTHMLLPRGLNQVYEENGGERISGALLHVKLVNSLPQKAREEIKNSEHYANSYEYAKYITGLEEGRSLWNNWSEQYLNWRQLEMLGLMSKGNWA